MSSIQRHGSQNNRPRRKKATCNQNCHKLIYRQEFQGEEKGTQNTRLLRDSSRRNGMKTFKIGPRNTLIHAAIAIIPSLVIL